MYKKRPIYLDTPVTQLFDDGYIDRTVVRSCEAAKPPMVTAGDILKYLELHGNFSNVPGCRRPGRIPDTLTSVARQVQPVNTPVDELPGSQRRQQASHLLNEADFAFLSDCQRSEVIRFRESYGHLPMFRILKYYLNRPDATRNDTIMAYSLGILEGDFEKNHSLADIAQSVNLSRERVRQITQTYELPEDLMYPRLWNFYADHSTYYADSNNSSFLFTVDNEVPELTFTAYAAVLQRTTMMHPVDDRFMARSGWEKEITAWVNHLTKLAAHPKMLDSRISLDGLTMAGSLDSRMNLVVINQIAPALGLPTDGNDAIILPKNI